MFFIKSSCIGLLLSGLVLLSSCRKPQQKKLTHTVTSHSHVTIVCNPLKGNNPYPSWGVFPSKKELIRRVFMDVTLGHPDSINIAHWDYLDDIRIKRVGGTNGDTLDLEIGKMITPYGSNFKKDWRWNWRIDVTDFSNILRDSVEIEYNHSGYEATNVGWDLNISFEIEMGDPVAKNIGFTELYDDRYSYGNPEKPIRESLVPKEIKLDEEATFGRLRILHTGHGADRPKGCSEFCNRWREVIVDGKTIDRRDMWKECADNNLYPQGGTWIFDRGYWCPGDLLSPDLIDFPVTKEVHTIDLEMEPYIATDNIQANEAISTVLFQYGEPSKQYDVSLEQIIVPNNAPELNRINPSATEPRIRIKNLGKQTLRSLTIEYGTKGFDEKTYQWEGELDFYQEAIVVLPGSIDFNFGENTFHATLKKPNSKNDEWPSDNFRESLFSSVKEVPQQVEVIYKSNNNPNDNTIRILDANRNVVYERTPEETQPNTLYTDSIHLDLGHYRMLLEDSSHNGLEFWFMPRQGFGYLQLSEINGRVLHRFESDCGIGEQLDFIAKEVPQIDNNVEQSLLRLYPRRISSKTQLFMQLEKPTDGEIQILKDGNAIKKIDFTQVKDKIFDIDISDFEDGRYVIELFLNGESKLKERISKETIGSR